MAVIAFFSRDIRTPDAEVLRSVGSIGREIGAYIARTDAVEALRDAQDRLDFALEASETGAWELDLVGDTAIRTLEHDRIFGYSQLRPQWGREVFMEHVLASDRAEVAAAFREAERNGELAFECRIRRRDGEIRWISARGRIRRDTPGGRTRMLGTVRDITARKLAEIGLKTRERQQEIVATLGHSALRGEPIERVMDMAVHRAAEVLGVGYAKVLQLIPHRDELLLRAGVGWKAGLVGHAAVGAGLDSQAGYTLASNNPVIVDDLRTETRFSGPPLLHQHNVVSGVSVIIRGRVRPWGVFGVHTRAKQEFTQDDVNFVQAVANVLGAVVQRQEAEEALRAEREDEKQARDDLERQRARLSVLSHASSVFAEAGPDLHGVLDVIAKTVVEEVADACSIRLLTEDGRKLRIVAAHAEDPELLEVLRTHGGGDIPADAGLPVRVLAGETVFVPVVAPEELQQGFRQEERAYLDRVRPRSFVIAPLRARGRVLGTLSAFQYTAPSSLTADDEALLRDLADRAALVIDNARLYEAERLAREELEHRVAEGRERS